MGRGYGGKRQKQLILKQAVPIILQDPVDLWQDNSGHRQQIDGSLRHLWLMEGMISEQWDTLLRAEERIYVEPLGAPEIGHRPLDLDVGQPIFVQAAPAQTQPVPLHWEAPVYEDHYRAVIASRTPNRTGAPIRHSLAKLDTFKGETGERLDDFVY